MADVPVKLRRARWAALIEHLRALDPEGGNEPLTKVQLFHSVKVHGILYLPATYTLDELDTRA